MAALDRGWIPTGGGNVLQGLASACAREDAGDYQCVVKRGQLDESVRKALLYVLTQEAKASGNGTISNEQRALLDQTGTELSSTADDVLGDYFEKHRMEGVTCEKM